MAEFAMRPPAPLVVDVTCTSMAHKWEEWVTTLEMYFIAAGIDDTKRQKALLLYIGGEQLRKIHKTLNDNNEEYKDSKELLDTYFKPKKNKTFERNIFYCTEQLQSESISSYIIRLKTKAETCDFDHYNADEAIVDQVISKCISTKLRRRLLRETDLDLDKLAKIAHAAESAEHQANEIEKNEEKINKISFENRKESMSRREVDMKDNKQKHCYGCGSNKHLHGSPQCPALGKTCNSCKKPNHFSSVCLKKKTDNTARY